MAPAAAVVAHAAAEAVALAAAGAVQAAAADTLHGAVHCLPVLYWQMLGQRAQQAASHAAAAGLVGSVLSHCAAQHLLVVQHLPAGQHLPVGQHLIVTQHVPAGDL